MPAVKANLHRGRERCANWFSSLRTRPPALAEHDRELLEAYIDRFDARDFDAVRRMIADDVRVDLVGRARMRGRDEVGKYFGNYNSIADWHLWFGFIDRCSASLVRKPSDVSGVVAHFMLVTFEDGKITTIRDYRYAPHSRLKRRSFARNLVTNSGLIFACGPDPVDQYRRAAGYVDRILKGEKPADLPVQAPTKYELVINLKTAKGAVRPNVSRLAAGARELELFRRRRVPRCGLRPLANGLLNAIA